MDEAYGKKTVTLAEASDKDIANAFFVREKDATAIKTCCSKHKLMVSFRSAGKDTLVRLDNGNPCKGHDILDKSIKFKGNAWTYLGTQAELDKYKGLVGYGDGDPKTLKGVWALSTSNTKTQATIKDLNDNKVSQTKCFTGDYDMHDLLGKTGRILATTPEEHSAIEYLNNAMLATDSSRGTNVTNTKGSKRNFESPYALIRHGAQTSYMSYLLSNEGKTDLTKALSTNPTTKLPHQDQVMNIDANIVMFSSDGKAYILNSIEKIYVFYKNNGLLNQIPFYYFFADLQTKYPANKKLGEYANTINGFLKNYIK